MATTIEDKKPEAEVSIPIPPPRNEKSPQLGTQYVHITNIESDFKPINNSCTSPEISEYNPNPYKPPKYPSRESSLTRRSTFQAKPKSRFGEPSVPIDLQTLESFGSYRYDHQFEFNPQSPQSDRPYSFTQKTLKESSWRSKGDSEKEKEKEGREEKEIYHRVTAQLSAKNSSRMTVKLVLELLVFLLVLGCLVSSLTNKRFKTKVLYGLKAWKWFVILLVTFSGMLVTHWIVHLFVFLIEWKFLLKKNVVYFTYGLKTSVEVFIWTGIVLGTWVLLFRPDVETTPKTKEILDFVTWTLVSILLGALLWLIKTTWIKLLACSFHVNRFFERIQEAIFHHYVLQALSGRPVVELARKISREESHSGQVSFTEHTRTHKVKKVVDWDKLHQMKEEKVPFRTMQLLVDVISNSGLSTMSGMLNKGVVEGGVKLDDDEITSEEEAIATAVRIFDNVVGDKDDQNYIDRSDLLKFMIWEEVNLVYPLIEVNDKGQISLKAFSKWVVKVYKDRQALQHALNDNKTAVKQFNKLLTGIVIVLSIIHWLLLTKIISTRLILVFSSQLLVAAFVFQNTCKTVFEAIIFIFVMHPFDVGDRCIIDGTMMVVEEMNILTTVFLKSGNEKLYYPNSVLATKAIGNYFRSPDQGDTFEFVIDYTTPLSKIGDLEDRIKLYLVKNPHYWHPDHSVVVKEIENINKIKMALYVNHTMNFQEFREKSKRRSELVLEMKSIFDELNIRYHLAPQEIHLSNNADK